MAYECKIIADSCSPEGHRLTTMEVTFPRFILAEVNTHRMLSRNSASSRAIPVAKSIASVQEDPFVPEAFGLNQPGMQADLVLKRDEDTLARVYWAGAREASIDYAAGLQDLEVHKSHANRILEPYKWHTALITATDWSNFFALRTDKSAQPEFRTIATMMRDAYNANDPYHCPEGCWHLPLVSFEELGENPDYSWWTKVSVGRCARVSYLTHDGKRDPAADIGLYNRLLKPGHLSPFEHVARPFWTYEWDQIRSLQEYREGWSTPFLCKMRKGLEYAGNLHGWWSARMNVPNEDDFGWRSQLSG